MTEANDGRASGGGQRGLLVFSWLLVGIPLAWGVVQTLGKAALLFK
ncbi:MAG TPA: hypothetical protein VEU27_12915 [Gemmatimonadales bacterium]|jgi:hypothetical protein|nr:hypothetical protein [Gemmatimonadales bacterium]